MADDRKDLSFTVITVSENKVRILRKAGKRLSEVIIPDMPSDIDDVDRRGGSRTQVFTSFASTRNASDSKAHHENKLIRFLREVDRVISTGLKKEPLVFGGTPRTIGIFKGLTKNKRRMIGYVKGNFDYARPDEISLKVEQVLKEPGKDSTGV